MTDNTATRSGLLTDEEIAVLTDPPEDDDTERAHLVDQLENRFRETLEHIRLLYMVLRDDEVRRLFTGPDNQQGTLRSQSQHVLAFLYYGLQQTDDDVRYRISSAIRDAEAANDRDATVTLDVTTQPFLPPKQRVQALEDGEYDRVSTRALERLWYDDRVPPSAVVDAFAARGEDDLTVADVTARREGTATVERMPAPVITDVTADRESTAEDGG